MDPNLAAAQQTINDLNAQILTLKSSRVSLKNTIKAAIPGWNGKLGAHMMGWFGDGTHRVNRYKSNDVNVIRAQMDAMQAIDIEFAIMTWQGIGNYVDDTTNKLITEILKRNMQFAYLLDPWIAKNKPNPTQVVIDQLSQKASILTSSCYLTDVDGKPLVCEFSLGAIGVDVNKVRQAHPELNILSWHTGYSWPNVGVNGLGQLSTLVVDNANPQMKIAGLNLGFNDAGYPLADGSRDYCHSVWSKTNPARVIDHQAGNWFYDQLKTIPATVPNIAMVTWNDHDEGTGIEQFVSMLTRIRIGN